MNNIEQERINQEKIRVESKITSFLKNYKIGTILNRSGIYKSKGVSPVKLFSSIFLLPFIGCNFFRGIVKNDSLNFEKDAAYNILKNPRYNWRKFLRLIAIQAIQYYSSLTKKEREKVLIIDDSDYNRSRSKSVELLSWIYDHNSKKYIKGFKLLTLGWSDGNSFIPLDFILKSSADIKKRIKDIQTNLDKRTCGYKRRVESIKKSTQLVEGMVERVLAFGIKADYILMDSWFGFPSVISTLSKHVRVICMIKKMPKVFYKYNRKSYSLERLYSHLKKKRGKAQVLADAIVELPCGKQAKIVFVRNRNKKREWLAIISTDIDLPSAEIVRIYGKRWDIEVFFKMMKHHLNLDKEIQLRNYDGLIGHITIVMTRYIFLSLEQRFNDDPRTIGGLFFACCDEMKDLTLIEALNRLIVFITHKIRGVKGFSEEVVNSIIDTIMKTAIDFINQCQRLNLDLT